MRVRAWGAALSIVFSASGAGAAPVESWEAYRPQTPEDAAADRITAAENQRFVEMSRAVDTRNAAKRAAYEAALAGHAAAVAAHEAALAGWEAEKAALEAAHAKAIADWEARVRSCEAGDRSQCRP